MNFSSEIMGTGVQWLRGVFSYDSVVGRVVRLPLRLIPKGSVVFVPYGKLRGSRWIVGSSNHGCWLGTYEHENQSVFAEAVHVGMTVYDIGAHVGFYSLLASRLVGEGGRVIAFEPFPENLTFLYEHLRLNRCNNVKVVEMALSDHGWVSRAVRGPSSSMNKLSASGDIEVHVTTLDEVVFGERLPLPDVIKRWTSRGKKPRRLQEQRPC